MYSIEEGKIAVNIARKTVEHHVAGKKIPAFEDVPEIFKKKSGVFVTLTKYPSHDLRGCIGYPEPHKRLIDALTDSAKSAATRDPRFNPVKEKELGKLLIEVSLLTPPELIEVKKPQEYLEKVKIGTHGLIVEKGFFRGLLLPQVPVEWKWDVEEFLSHTCMKARLTPDCWFEKGVKLYAFTATVFSEKKPRGEVEIKRLG